MPLPLLLSVSEIHARLQTIFPEGTPNRNNCTWEIAARTIFVMLYCNAIEGSQVWLRPDQVTRMTDSQAAVTDDEPRLTWTKSSVAASKGEATGRWHAANTRESIRDDTLRGGLIANGTVVERTGLPTTSPAGRYALKADFAALFKPRLRGRRLESEIKAWQATNLSAGALARIAILRKGAVATGDHVLVTFPNGETRRMAPGPSSIISKAVVEEFAPRFLAQLGVIFVSESGNKIVARDDALAQAIKLHIRADRSLPDIVLVDLGPKHPLLVFVEVVATDGPVTPERKAALLHLAQDAGFPSEHVAFVIAYFDRSAPAFRKNVESLSWGSFAWFVAEPEHLVMLYEGEGTIRHHLSEWSSW